MSFVHLHNHSEFSLLDGNTKVYDMVRRAADLRMPAIALTDHGVMSGLPELENAVAKVASETDVHVKPIFGCEIYFCRDESLKTGDGHARLNHMILLAKTEEGYYNLVKLVSESHVDNFYYKPRTTMPMLKKYGKGLMATSACVAGIIPKTLDVKNLSSERYAEAKEWAFKLAECFDPGDFYIEIQNQEYITHAGLTQTELNYRLTHLARDCGIKTVAANDFHYLTQEDAAAQDILLCIG
ncbi:MAG: PHP domain-containing protein, partial [Eggerthellaceae bacterium]|nr:PHP domain-containing protein [Eggerthellaceae bacterium]